MQAVFQWNAQYETGLAQVDAQHRHLVELLNALGAAIDDQRTERVDAALGELADYAVYHFRTEETLMAEAGLSAEHVRSHARNHADFLKQVGDWVASHREEGLPTLAEVVDYLANWLMFHILGEDQEMAREMAALRAGASVDEAHASARLHLDPRTGILLASLRTLYAGVLDRNAQLAGALRQLKQQRGELLQAREALTRVNADLEGQVARRTSQLIQAEKLAAVGQLAAGVAHEINNPLAVVNANLGVLRALTEAQNLAPESRLDWEQLLDECGAGLARASRIVRALLDYTRVGDLSWRRVDLAGLLRQAAEKVADDFPGHPPITLELADTPAIDALPEELGQAVEMLLRNACQATAEAGAVTLALAGDEGGQARVEVRDDGAGMAADVLRRACEPFFTTRPVGQGTGLGLPLAQRIVERHGGRLEVASEPGHGTLARIRLPLRQPDARTSDIAP